jgi:hypothetical protein
MHSCTRLEEQPSYPGEVRYSLLHGHGPATSDSILIPRYMIVVGWRLKRQTLYYDTLPLPILIEILIVNLNIKNADGQKILRVVCVSCT